MAQNTIDSLDIVISADTSKATKQVNTLIKKLGALRNTFKSLNSINGGIKPLVEGLRDIANIDFSKAEKGLQALATIVDKIDRNKIKQLGDLQKGLGGDRATAQGLMNQSREPDIGSVAKMFSSSNYSQIANFNVHVSKELADAYRLQAKEAQMALDPLVQLNERLAELGFESDQIREIGNAFNSLKPTYTREQLEALRQTLKSLGLTSKQASKVMKKSGALEGGKNSSAIGRFSSRVIGRLIFSVVRLIVQAIKDLIKQLIQDFAQVDKEFNKIISEAYSAVKYLSNAIKASFAPVIQSLAPILTMLADVLGDVLNKVAEFSAMMNGQDYYYRAVRNAEDFADTLEQAKKNITFGFDELNVISGEDKFQKFERVELTNQTQSLKYIVKSLQHLEPILDFIGKLLFAMPVEAIYAILKFFEPAIILIADTLATIFETFGAILQSIPAVLHGLFTGDWSQFFNVWKKFADNVSTIWRDFANVIVPIVQSVNNFISGIWNAISNFFGGGGGKGMSVSGGTKTFATGGFPEDGLFMANHNELVGGFAGGKTAVVNNQQITQGIYQAVLQAMRESSGGNVVVQIDGKTIARAVNEQNANMGSQFLMGGNINYGKL